MVSEHEKQCSTVAWYISPYDEVNQAMAEPLAAPSLPMGEFPSVVGYLCSIGAQYRLGCCRAYQETGSRCAHRKREHYYGVI